MCRIEPLQHFGFIVGDVDARNSLCENVTTDCDRAQRRKLFKRQIHFCTSSLWSNMSLATVILGEAKDLRKFLLTVCSMRKSNQKCFALLNMTAIWNSLRLPNGLRTRTSLLGAGPSRRRCRSRSSFFPDFLRLAHRIYIAAGVIGFCRRRARLKIRKQLRVTALGTGRPIKFR